MVSSRHGRNEGVPGGVCGRRGSRWCRNCALLRQPRGDSRGLGAFGCPCRDSNVVAVPVRSRRSRHRRQRLIPPGRGVPGSRDGSAGTLCGSSHAHCRGGSPSRAWARCGRRDPCRRRRCRSGSLASGRCPWIGAARRSCYRFGHRGRCSVGRSTMEVRCASTGYQSLCGFAGRYCPRGYSERAFVEAATFVSGGTHSIRVFTGIRAVDDSGRCGPAMVRHVHGCCNRNVRARPRELPGTPERGVCVPIPPERSRTRTPRHRRVGHRRGVVCPRCFRSDR